MVLCDVEFYYQGGSGECLHCL